MKALPSLVSILRIAAVPPLAAGAALGRPAWAMTALAYACATDLADGYLARRLGAVSSLGAYLDVTADFLVVLAGFAGFAARGVYPGWLPWIIVLMFAQFIATSRVGRPVYDPVGKYYGAVLFAGIGVTLLLEDAAVHQLVLAGIVACTLASLLTRARYLAFTRVA